MKNRKPKASEPSLLDELSKPLRDLVADFKLHGADALQTVREQDPQKYLELCTKILPLIVGFNPGTNDFADCQSQHDIGVKLLQSVGFNDPDDASIEDAIKANDTFVERLKAIYFARMQ